ncbi:MAG TPA: iron ABC transporter permease [Anaerolineaceae bacterium]|nr:iron ABC transporter permease [Anaerolineaceae bacterium]
MEFKKRKRNQTIQAIGLWLLPLGFVLAFFYRPLITIFSLIFSQEFLSSSVSLNLSKTVQPLLFTLKQASLSTLFTLLVGLPIAYLFSHFQFPGRKLLQTLTFIPFILPTVVVAAAFTALIGPRGWLNLALVNLFGLKTQPIQWQGTLTAVVLAHVFYNLSLVVRIVGSAWSRLNPRLGQAARSLGATPLRSFFEITLPLLGPALTGALLLVFLFDFTSFGVVLMLGSPNQPTLDVAIYQQALYYFNLPQAGLLSIIQLACTLLLSTLHDRLGTARTGKYGIQSESNALRQPRNAREKLFILVSVLCLLILITAPLLSLASRSVVALEATRGERGQFQTGFTLRFYQELFQNRTGSIFYVSPLVAILNSLKFSIATVLISVVLGLLASYALVKEGVLNRLLLPFFMLPLGASAITLGLGFVLTYNRGYFIQQGFPWILPIAHSLLALPLVVRTLLPALRNIPANVRESARSLGANPLRAWLEIDLPLMLRPLLVAAIFAFTISLGEFGATSFLSTPSNPTIPVAIYRYISQPGALNYGQAMAMATLLMVTCGAGIFLIERIKLPGEDLF